MQEEQNTPVSEQTSSFALNARQSEILQQIGVAPDTSSLTPRQKSGIVEIERMLQYLETRYQREFCYLGYANDMVEGSWLTAYPADGSRLLDVVTVRQTGEGDYVDDYPWIPVRALFSRCVEAFFQDALRTEAVKAVTLVGGTDITDLKALSPENLYGHCHGSAAIFVLEDGAQLEAAVKAFGQWNLEHGFYGLHKIAVVQSELALKLITRFNYGKQMRSATKVINCFVSREGDCRISCGGVTDGNL